MILAILGQDTLILSLECPSGLDTGEGKVFAPCVLATCTLILGLPKTGLLPESARPAVGQMFLADVSVPPAAYARLGLEDLPPLFDRGGLARLV
jgi:NAD(P)H-hydrate epimerase